MRRFSLPCLLVLGVLLWAAVPAGAHTELKSTDPPGGAALENAPRRIALEFTGAVEDALATIRLVDNAGSEVALPAPRHADGTTRAVAVEVPNLTPGSYAVAWRVVSADAHPLQGTFTFEVRSSTASTTSPAAAPDAPVPPDNRVAARRLLTEDRGPTVGVLYGVVRFGAFTGLLVLVGAGAFVLALWPRGLASRRVRRLLATALVLTAVCTAAAIVLQGPYAGGRALADGFDVSLLRATAETRLGVAYLFRLALLAGLSLVMWGLLGPLRERRPWPVIVTGAVIACGLLVTPGIAGHAAAADNAALMLASDFVHLVAAAFWVGGIAVLVAALLPGGDTEAVDAVVPRFARLAFVAVVVIIVTGSVQGWQQLGDVDAATRTSYGRLLVTKVALFAAMVAAAGLSRRWLRRRYRGAAVTAPAVGAAVAAPVGVGVLRRSVAVEAAVGAAVLAVTAMLVNAVPGRTALAEPYSTTLEMHHVVVDVTVDPAKAGPADVHVYTLEPAGAVKEVGAVDATLTAPGEGAPPTPVPLHRAGPGHYSATGVELLIPGRWRLDIVVRAVDGGEARGRASLPVR